MTKANPIQQNVQGMQQACNDRQIEGNPRSGLDSLRLAFAQDKVPVIAFVPRLESLVTGDVSHDPNARFIVDCLLDFAEDDQIAKRGHLLVAVAREASLVSETLVGSNSRVVQLRLIRPEEDARERFFRRLTVSEELRQQCQGLIDERQGAVDKYVGQKRRAVRDLQDQERELKAQLKTINPSEKLVRQREQRESDIKRLQEEERQLRTNFKEALPKKMAAVRRTLKAQEKWLADRRMSNKLWRKLKPGDGLCGFIQNVGLVVYQVLDVDQAGQIQLTKAFESTSPLPAEKSADNGVMCSEAGVAEFTGQPLRFEWVDESRIIIGQEIDGCGGVAFWFPQRASQEDNPQYELYALKAKDAPSSVQERIDKLVECQHDVFELEQTLKKVESGEDVEDVEAERAAAAVLAAEQKLDGAKKAIEKALRDQQADTKKKIVDCDQKQRKAEELIVDVRGPRIILPNKLKGYLEKVDADLVTLRSGRFSPPAAELDRLARLSNGLGYRHLRDLLAMADVSGHQLNELELLAAKTRMLNDSYGHLVKVVQSQFGFEGIGGLEHLKRMFRDTVQAILDGDYRRVPMGILLNGPPGTGKTAIAEALAHESGYTYVSIRSLRNMFVGETERQTQVLFAILRELAPVIVLRDEVDEEDSGRDSYQGDSGVSGRVRQAWMTFLSDPTIRGRVLVVSISNRPDRLDAALKRAGRADFRVPVLMPDLGACEKIFEVMFKVRHEVPTKITNFEPFAREAMKLTLSGADIERVTLDSYMWAKGPVAANDLRKAMDVYVPSVEPREVHRMSRIAIEGTSHKLFLPDDLQATLADCLASAPEEVHRRVQMTVAAALHRGCSAEEALGEALSEPVEGASRGGGTMVVVPVPVKVRDDGSGEPSSGSGAPPAGSTNLN